VRRRLPKAVRVISGILLMAAFVLIALAVLVRYAGGWGVPYFSFTNDRGSRCVNNLTGYTCTPLTLADVEFYGDIDLPDDSVTTSGRYVSTHDYQLDATLTVPAQSAARALAVLNKAFGKCLSNHPSPLNTTGLKSVCVLSNDDAVTNSRETSSRLYIIGTGVAKDGTRQIALSIKSR
jgi:hypothetical protein